MQAKGRSRPVDALNLLLKQRKTTVPELQDDDVRSGKGPPSEPLEALFTWLTKAPSMGLYLISTVIDQQRFEDATGWWPGAKDYLERIARLMGVLKAELPRESSFLERLPFTGADLLYRLGRIKLLEIISERLESFATQFRGTLLVERADVMRMGDMVMTEVEMLLGRPTFAGPSRETLQEMAKMPLHIWTTWQESIAETQRKNEKLRSERQGEIDAANSAAAAARAAAGLSAGPSPADGAFTAAPVVAPRLAPPPAGRTGRSRRR